MPTTAIRSKTVRRSIALPSELLEALLGSAPSSVKRNLNRMIRAAIEEYVAHRTQAEFARAMEEMAADPQVRREHATISSEFRKTASDGLKP